MSFLPQVALQPSASETAELVLQQKVHKYYQACQKLDGDIFEANIRAWRYYYAFWINLTKPMSKSSIDSRDNSDSEEDKKDLKIETKTDLALKKVASKLFTMSEEITWAKYIYPYIKRIQNTKTVQARDDLYVLLNTVRAFYSDLLKFVEMIQRRIDTRVSNKSQFAGEYFLKYTGKWYSHLGDVERYIGTKASMHVASGYYSRMHALTNGRSGYSLNQLATVQVSTRNLFLTLYGVPTSHGV